MSVLPHTFINQYQHHFDIQKYLYYKDNLKKGKKFYIEGRISKRDYNDKDGNKRTSTDVISEKLIPLEGRSGESAGTAEAAESYSSEPPQVENNDDLPF